jgi:transposase
VEALIGKAVDTVPKRENREFRTLGDATLAGSKYLWSYAEEHLPERHQEQFAALKALTLKTGWAWVTKESLRELRDFPTRSRWNTSGHGGSGGSLTRDWCRSERWPG